VLALTVIGIWTLLSVRERRETRWLIGIWALTMFATTALLTPLEWQRYYLPGYPAVGLLAAYGLVWLVQRWRQPR
jgi:hypothetical protein